MGAIRVLIADDHRLFRQGLRQICEVMGGFEVIGEAENGQDAAALARKLRPDIVLMDLRMPLLGGVPATQLITTDLPDTRVIILTMYRQDRLALEAIKAGARGYLLKDVDEQELVAAVRTVHSGEALIDPLLATRLVEEFQRLGERTPRPEGSERLTQGEMDVLVRVAQGEDNKTIAERLSLAESTVANRLGGIFQKLQVNNRTQAALYALRQGWVNLDEDAQGQYETW